MASNIQKEGALRVTIFQNIPASIEELLEQLKVYKDKTDMVVFPELFLTQLLEDKKLKEEFQQIRKENPDEISKQIIAKRLDSDYWNNEKRKEEEARTSIVNVLKDLGIAAAIGGSDYRVAEEGDRIANSYWIYDSKGNMVSQFDRPITRTMPTDDYRYGFSMDTKFSRVAKDSNHIAQLPFKDGYINIGTVFDDIDTDSKYKTLKSFEDKGAALILNPAIKNPLVKGKYETDIIFKTRYQKFKNILRDNLLPGAAIASVVRVDSPSPNASGTSFALARGSQQFVNITKTLSAQGETKAEDESLSWAGTVQVPVRISPKLEQKLTETADSLGTAVNASIASANSVERKLGKESTPKLEGSVTIDSIDCQQNNEPNKPYTQYINDFLKPIAKKAEENARSHGKKLIAVGWDMDGTFNFQYKHAQAELLGGPESIPLLNSLANNGCVLKIISATDPKADDTVYTLQEVIRKLDEKVVQKLEDSKDAGDLSGKIKGKPSLAPVFVNATLEFGTFSDVNRPKDVVLQDINGNTKEVKIVDFHNIMLSRYDKGFAMIVALKERIGKMTKKDREEIEEIDVNFIDDFIPNPYEFASQFLNFASEIKALCPKAKININSCWLKVPERPGEESSYNEQCKPLRDDIQKLKGLSIEEFKQEFDKRYGTYLKLREEAEKKKEELERQKKQQQQQSARVVKKLNIPKSLQKQSPETTSPAETSAVLEPAKPAENQTIPLAPPELPGTLPEPPGPPSESIGTPPMAPELLVQKQQQTTEMTQKPQMPQIPEKLQMPQSPTKKGETFKGEAIKGEALLHEFKYKQEHAQSPKAESLTTSAQGIARSTSPDPVDIVRDSQQYGSPDNRTGGAYQAFKALLGLKEDDQILAVKDNQIKIKKDNKVQWHLTAELYKSAKEEIIRPKRQF